MRKPRRPLNISGLELLHSHTLESTRAEIAGGERLPPPRGCVDQQLSALSAFEEPSATHHELDIPKAPKDTPYALQILLDIYKDQFLSFIETMKDPSYKAQIAAQVNKEKVIVYFDLCRFFVEFECYHIVFFL